MFRLHQKAQPQHLKHLIAAAQGGLNPTTQTKFQSTLIPQQKQQFSSQKNQNYKQSNKSRFAASAGSLLMLGLAAGVYYSTDSNMAFAEQAQQDQEQRQDDVDKAIAAKKKEPTKDGGSSQEQRSDEQQPSPLEIPRLIMEREAAKRREYSERTQLDVRDIMSDQQARSIRVADRDQDHLMHADPGRGELMTTEQFYDGDDTELIEGDEDDFDDEGEETLNELVKDPFTKKQKATKEQMLTPQQYRVVTIGDESIVKEGQMIQVSISDPFNPDKFYPTDKIIVLKHQDQLYAVGSYCGFDFTNLATGALLGEKLICPTCCSAYDVKNGLVDIGPSMRNLSSFNIKIREEKIKVTVPEHIPAFSKRKFLSRSKIDPRTFVVLGDSEAALAAIDALRMNFTGQIVNIPVSQYGQFENTDILRRKFTPLSKNETFMTDLDFLDRANVTVIKGEIKGIDKTKKQIKMKGIKEVINFDKMLVAWGAYKRRLNKEYSNVFYLEDRYSHAKCHNEILKAKKILVLGSSMDAFQTAASVRQYLNSIGYQRTEVILLYEKLSEVRKNMGAEVSNTIHKMLRQEGVSVIENAKITGLVGDYKVERIHFRKHDENTREEDKLWTAEGGTDYFLKPDCVIVEDGVGRPKVDLKPLVGHEESGNLHKLTFGNTGIPISNIRFSLLQNDIMSPILAAGSCTHYPSFMHKIKVRTDDIKYNIESGFYAAMNMMDKQVEFRYIPMTPLTIGDKKLYFVGEREQPITGVIFKGKVGGDKWVAFFTYGDEICGFLTCGYQNLHIYLLEAMKHLIMPTAAMLQAADGNFDDIVNSVLRMRPYIECGRPYTLQTPSVIRAEFTREIEALNELRGKFRSNIKGEEAKVQQKLDKIKSKFDRDGVNFVQDESQIGRQTEGQQQQRYQQQPMDPTNLGPKQFDAAPPAKGHPSMAKGVNMGGNSNSEVNPIKNVIQQTNSMFTPK